MVRQSFPLALPEISTVGFAHLFEIFPAAAEAFVEVATVARGGAVGRVGFPFKAVEVFAADLFVDSFRLGHSPAYLDEVLPLGCFGWKFSFHEALEAPAMPPEDINLLWAEDFKTGLDCEGHDPARSWSWGQLMFDEWWKNVDRVGLAGDVDGNKPEVGVVSGFGVVRQASRIRADGAPTFSRTSHRRCTGPRAAASAFGCAAGGSTGS